MSETTRQEPADIIPGGLPVKITGIVFWGMVLVGLLIAFIMLEGQERELAARNDGFATLLEQELVAHLTNELHDSAPFSKSVRGDLKQIAERLQPNLHFEAIELSSQGDTLLFGDRRAGQEAVTRNLPIASAQSAAAPSSIRMTVFWVFVKECG